MVCSSRSSSVALYKKLEVVMGQKASARIKPNQCLRDKQTIAIEIGNIPDSRSFVHNAKSSHAKLLLQAIDTSSQQGATVVHQDCCCCQLLAAEIWRVPEVVCRFKTFSANQKPSFNALIYGN